MVASELRGKDRAALTSELLGLQKELFNIRFQRVAQQYGNTARIRTLRRDIARIKTISLEMANPKNAQAGSKVAKKVTKK